jgi:ferredoxin
MDVDTIDKEREKKNYAKINLACIVQQINECQSVEKEPHVGRWPRINSRLIGEFFERKLVNDKAFRVETNRCVRCGICAEVCPTADIEGGKGQRPTWKHNGSCLTCFACYHRCPQHAIEFGNQTKKKGQYWYTKNQ